MQLRTITSWQMTQYCVIPCSEHHLAYLTLKNEASQMCGFVKAVVYSNLDLDVCREQKLLVSKLKFNFGLQEWLWQMSIQKLAKNGGNFYCFNLIS